jgi:hypothetical protein
MKGFLERITMADYRKSAKRLVIITLIVVLAGGALTTWMMRPQLVGLVALEKANEQGEHTDGRSWQQADGGRINAHEHEEREIEPFDSGLVPRPSVASCIVAITYIVACGLCALAYWLMVAAWLYKASAKAGMNRALWAILGLAGNILALAAFLIVRGSMSRCPKCGASQRAAHYCRTCGALMERTCPECGKDCAGTDRYCPDCGTSLNGGAETKEK